MTDKIIHSKAFAKLVQQKPKGVFLFGSAHTGGISATSDIDLAVFFEKKANAVELSKIKSQLSNELQREVDLIVLTKEKIANMKKQETELLNQIQNKSTLMWGAPLESIG
ncbi:MAG: nucleotidyltransferase domain-containing protein [Candidatus Micrarchaeota archaeon]